MQNFLSFSNHNEPKKEDKTKNHSRIEKISYRLSKFSEMVPSSSNLKIYSAEKIPISNKNNENQEFPDFWHKLNSFTEHSKIFNMKKMGISLKDVSEEQLNIINDKAYIPEKNKKKTQKITPKNVSFFEKFNIV